MMLSTLAVLVCVAVLMTPGLCCDIREYETSDGICCPMCSEGTVVKRDCTKQSGTRCASCVDGTFMNQASGLKSCFHCTSCDKGLVAKQQCTATSDTICGVSEGYFCKELRDDTGCSLAQKHTRCESGHRIKTPGTSRTDTVCEPCPHGHFSLHGVNCMQWTRCSETQKKVKEGDAHRDVVCREIASRAHHVLPVPFLLSLLTVVGLLIKVTKDWGKRLSVAPPLGCQELFALNNTAPTIIGLGRPLHHDQERYLDFTFQLSPTATTSGQSPKACVRTAREERERRCH